MIFLVMALAFTVLLLWSVASTPRVIRRTGPRVWLWWAVLLVVLTLASQAALRQGLEVFG